MPEASRVLLHGGLDPSVTGSMNELVRLATGHLVDQALSLNETSCHLKETPMSRLGYSHPRAAFAALGPGLHLG